MKIFIFDESLSKTFHGGLRDLTKKSRCVKHKCHEIGETHSPCLVSMYTLYLSKVSIYAKSATSFYLQRHRHVGVEYEIIVVGVCTLNKILPELREKADLERKSLIVCA